MANTIDEILKTALVLSLDIRGTVAEAVLQYPAWVTAKQDLYQRLLEVIGADEVEVAVVITPNAADSVDEWGRGRNELRAAQRKALAEVFGVK